MNYKHQHPEICPLCDKQYDPHVQGQFNNVRTKHHIFPKFWYHSGVVVYACSLCHTYEFHIIFSMDGKVWTRSECLQNWVKFCKFKGKNAFEIYPQLTRLEALY